MVLKLNGALTSVKGSIELTVGARVRQVRLNTEFVVFDSASHYDAIMGQPLIFNFRGNGKLAEGCQMNINPSRQRSSLGMYMTCIFESNRDSLDLHTKVEEGEPVEKLDSI